MATEIYMDNHHSLVKGLRDVCYGSTVKVYKAR